MEENNVYRRLCFLERVGQFRALHPNLPRASAYAAIDLYKIYSEAELPTAVLESEEQFSNWIFDRSAPNKEKHKPDPDYLQSLLFKIGLSHLEVARSLDIKMNQFQPYFDDPSQPSYQECPYVVQYALEQWAKSKSDDNAYT